MMEVLACFIAPRYNGTRLYIYIQTGNHRKWEWKCTISCSLNPFPFCVRPNFNISGFFLEPFWKFWYYQTLCSFGLQLYSTSDPNYNPGREFLHWPQGRHQPWCHWGIFSWSEVCNYWQNLFIKYCFMRSQWSLKPLYFAEFLLLFGCVFSDCLSNLHEIDDIYPSLWHKELN